MWRGRAGAPPARRRPEARPPRYDEPVDRPERHGPQHTRQRAELHGQQLQPRRHDDGPHGVRIRERLGGREGGSPAPRIAEVQDLRKGQRRKADRGRPIRRVLERPQKRRQRRCRDEPSIETHALEEPTCQQRRSGVARRALHHLRIRRLHRQGERGQRVGDEIQIQDLEGEDDRGKPGESGDEQHGDLGQVAAEQIEDELLDVVVDDASFLDGRSHGLEAVVLQDNRRRLLGDVRAPAAHGDAHVGLAERGRIVHAVAEHGHDLAASLKGADDLQLVLGRHPTEGADPGDAGVQLAARNPGELAPVDYLGGAVEQGELAPHGLRRQPLITRDHDRSQAGAGKPGDGRFHAGGGRIHQSQEADEGQVVERGFGDRRHRARREPEHAQPGRRHVGIDPAERVPLGALEPAQLEDACRGALDAGGRRAVVVVKRRHEPPGAGERHEPEGGTVAVQGCRVESDASGGGEDGPVDGIARGRIALGRVGLPAAGEHRDLEGAAQGLIGRWIGALDRERVEASGRPDAHHRHLARRERTRLVGADHGRRPERLDGRQPADQRVPAGHAVQPHGQRDRRNRRERLGDRRDGERDRGFDHQAEPLAVQRLERADERRDAERQPHETAPEHVQASLERRTLFHEPGDERPDPPDLRSGSGRSHDGPRRAAGDRRALVGHVHAVGERCRDVEEAVRVLFDRQRLAGEGRLVDQEVGGRQQTRVGRHGLAGLQLDQIPGDEIFSRHDREPARADDRRARYVEAQECLHRLPGAILGGESDHGVQRQNSEDGARFDEVAERDRHPRGRSQQHDDDAGELVPEDPPARHPPGARQTIGAHALAPRRGFLEAESFGGRGEAVQRLTRGECVPAVLSHARRPGRVYDGGRQDPEWRSSSCSASRRAARLCVGTAEETSADRKLRTAR